MRTYFIQKELNVNGVQRLTSIFERVEILPKMANKCVCTYHKTSFFVYSKLTMIASPDDGSQLETRLGEKYIFPASKT